MHRDLETATYRIAEDGDGWRIDLRFRVSLLELLPGYLLRNLPIALRAYAAYALVGLVFLWQITREAYVNLFVALPLTALAALALTVVAWPLRFGKYGPPSRDYLLRYHEGNRHESIRASHTSVDLPDGMYALHCLESLRVVGVDAAPGLWNLVFDGDVVRQVTLVKWPGLPEQVALALRDAIIERIARGAASGAPND